MDKYEFLEQTESEVDMTGAIEFMRAWRDICAEQTNCDNCKVSKHCKLMNAEVYTDKDITEIVRAVMAQKRGRE